MNNKDTIELQIAFNPEHHRLKRTILRTVYRAYETAWKELTQTINYNNALEATILDHYLSLSNYIQTDQTEKFLNTVALLSPMIQKLDVLEIPDRSKSDCKKTIHDTLYAYFNIA